jgi:predicted secreted hydrolase
MPRPISILLAGLLAVACGGGEPAGRSGISVVEALGGGAIEGHARAIEVREFAFPADHGPHPEFRSEWWYFTGNLDGADGRRFGFHLTFFRNAVRPEEGVGEGSPWRTRQLWMAHFALTDAEAGSMHAAERFARGAMGLAGASAQPFAVQVDDWSVRSAGGDFAPLRLRAQDRGVAITLDLEPQKPPVLQGDRGLSRKSGTPGNASYYYSLTRLAARGTVRVAGGAEFAVRGSAWCDREWSTSALDEGQVGWDWFALQLDDGRDLMFYRIRRADGSSDPSSNGVLVGRDGAVTRLALGAVGLEESGGWTSPRSGAEYPAGFRLVVAGQGLDLEIVPLLADQELDLTFRYWEGAVEVRGSHPGRGYLEMTGYADRREGR